MDISRLFTGLMNRLFRQVLNKGINAGIGYAARRGKSPDQLTEADHDQARKARDLTKRARQAARITRRFGR